MSFKLREDSKEPEKFGAATPVPANSGASSSGSSRPDAVLGKGTKVVGTLTFSGSAEIDCQVEGEINARETLTIAEAALINGKVIGSEIVVRGTVNGDIIASKKLSLRRPARIMGNVSCSNLSIEEGVIFEGKCSMSGATSSDMSKQNAGKPGGAERAGAAA